MAGKLRKCIDCKKFFSCRQSLHNHKKRCQGRERQETRCKRNVAETISSMLSRKPRVKQKNIIQNDDHVDIPPMKRSKQIQPPDKTLTESDGHGIVIKSEKDITKEEQEQLHHIMKSSILPEPEKDVSKTHSRSIWKEKLQMTPSVFAKSKNDSPGIPSTSTKSKKDSLKLPSTTEGLSNRIRYLVDKFNSDGNKTVLKPEMIAILHKLKEKGAISGQECHEICDIIKDVCSMENDSKNESSDEMETEEESNVDTDEASDETVDEQGSTITDKDFHQLIDTTIEKLTRNLRRNLNILILGIDDKMREKVLSFLYGEELAQSVTHYLGNDTDSIKIKILIDEIDRIQRQVKNVLTEIRGTHDQDTVRTLENLKMRGVINEEQFKKMMVAQNDIFSYARAMSGAGLWLGHRK